MPIPRFLADNKKKALLLTALAGFEIIYAAIETSVLVTGLLAGINLGLALVGAYLIISPTMEPSG